MEFVPTRKAEVLDKVADKNAKWKASTSDPMTGAEVYRALAEDMVCKYIHKANFIKSIKRKQNYNGTVTIIVTYDHRGIACDDVRAIYTIKG